MLTLNIVFIDHKSRLRYQSTKAFVTETTKIEIIITMIFIFYQLQAWQPGIKNPYRGMVVWPVPENVDITATLYRVRHTLQMNCGLMFLVGIQYVKIIQCNVLICFLTQDPHADEFEDKDWTFVIENVSAPT